MNTKLIEYLEAHEAEFVGEWEKGLKSAWNSRLASDSMSGNERGIRTTSSCSCGCSKTDAMFSMLVKRYYHDLLLSLKHRADGPSEEFPHQNPYGVRLTLGSLLELLLTGENVFSKNLLNEINSCFTGIKSINAFDEVSRALRQVFRSYSQQFCNECISPLASIVRQIANQTKSQTTLTESYARRSYPI